jgi:hypothetical protein
MLHAVITCQSTDSWLLSTDIDQNKIVLCVLFLVLELKNSLKQLTMFLVLCLIVVTG